MPSKLIIIGGIYLDINCTSVPFGKAGLLPEQEVISKQYITEPGGSAVNFARLCAHLGVESQLIGKIGNDEAGKAVQQLLAIPHLEPKLLVDDTTQTNLGLNFSNVDHGTVMVAAGSANQALNADEVLTTVGPLFTRDSYLYIGGCFKLDTLMPAFTALAAQAKQLGATIILDHARVPATASETDRQIVRELALASSYYLPSRDEFLTLWGYTSLEEGLLDLSQKTTAVIVVKDGQQGVISLDNGKVITQPAFAVTPLHTVGAGDSFNAGYIAARLDGQDHAMGLRFGCAVAALKISQDSLPTVEQAAKLL